MGAISAACSLLVLWMTLLPLEGQTIRSHLVDRSTPLYQATADAVADLQKLVSESSPPRKTPVNLSDQFSPQKSGVFDILPQRPLKRAVFDILPHRVEGIEEEARSRKFEVCCRFLRSLTSRRSWKSEMANQWKLKNLIRKLIRNYFLVEKVRLIRNGRSIESSVVHDDKRGNLSRTTSSSSQQNH